MASLKLKFSLVSDEDVFRIVMIPDNASFTDLDSIVNSAFQWGFCYGHRFVVSDETMDREDEPYTALADMKGEDILYVYLMDRPCAVRIECIGESDRDLRGTPVLMRWKATFPRKPSAGGMPFHLRSTGVPRRSLSDSPMHSMRTAQGLSMR